MYSEAGINGKDCVLDGSQKHAFSSVELFYQSFTITPTPMRFV